MTLRAMGILGVSSATSKFHNDDCLGATIALAYVGFLLGGRANCCDESCIPGEIHNLSKFPEFSHLRVKRHVLILESKMECGTGCLRDEIAGRKVCMNGAEYSSIPGRGSGSIPSLT
jgi:hypothetical protein